MASTDSIVSYYSGLLIRQYATKPKAIAHIGALIRPVIMDQMPTLIMNSFSVGNAAGKQLDVIGKYVGVARVVATGTGSVNLTDDDFRTLIRMVQIKNTAGSSLSVIQDLLSQRFPGVVAVTDNQTMQLNYRVASNLGSSDLLNALLYGNFFPRPMGVQVSITIVPSLSTPFFGLRNYSNQPASVTPLNSYAFYNTNYPWLSYSGVINV